MKLTIKQWFKDSKTMFDLKVDNDGLYAFKMTDIFDVDLIKETEKAIFVKLKNCNDSILNNKQLWLPKSVIQIL